MPRATCSSDVFNAIAEARRRDILVYLAGTERQESAKHASELVPALEQSVTTAKQILIAMDARRSRRRGGRSTAIAK